MVVEEVCTCTSVTNMAAHLTPVWHCLTASWQATQLVCDELMCDTAVMCDCADCSLMCICVVIVCWVTSCVLTCWLLVCALGYEGRVRAPALAYCIELCVVTVCDERGLLSIGWYYRDVFCCSCHKVMCLCVCVQSLLALNHQVFFTCCYTTVIWCLLFAVSAFDCGGGGVYVSIGGGFGTYITTVTLTDCNMTGNIAGWWWVDVWYCCNVWLHWLLIDVHMRGGCLLSDTVCIDLGVVGSISFTLLCLSVCAGV